ncbi:GNAT family N-acetyltransferase [Clostridium ihumii]|uniref:GNAT family N-acetyltransferase n=1 Tax=Clostridium ihumii TaxID=1470356 RepID=UPI003D346AC3
MKIDIKDVNKENLKDILELNVNESQSSYIETTRQCLNEAEECNSYRPVGLYSDGVLVGFAMYGLFKDEGKNGRVWLDRLLIDKKYQGKGLGHIMLEALINHLTQIYNCDEIFLSLYEDNKCAMHIYEKFGFKFNGELDINNEKVMVKKL